MYWTLDSDDKIWFHHYLYEAEKHIKIRQEFKNCEYKLGPVEPFGLHPDLDYWLSDVEPSCGTGSECLCHESFNSVYKYVKTRLAMDEQREILKEKIQSGKYNQHITVR